MFVGTGSSISFASGFLAEILDISGPGLSRIAIAAEHMGTTGGKPKVPGDLYDPGELTVEIAFNPATTPPITSVAEAITITWGDSASTTWTCNGFMSGFEPGAPLEERATGSATLTLSGSVSFGS